MVIAFIPSKSDNPQQDSILSSNSIIRLKLYGGPMKGEEYEYDPKVQSKIVIGRSPDADIPICADNLLSKK